MKIRVFERDNGEIVVQRWKLFFWITLFKTHDPRFAIAFLEVMGIHYNEQTGYYE